MHQLTYAILQVHTYSFNIWIKVCQGCCNFLVWERYAEQYVVRHKKRQLIRKTTRLSNSISGIIPSYSCILMICTGQRSAASRAQAARSSGGFPSAMLPLMRYFSIIWLNESSGSCSNNPGHASQHEPQLTQVMRSITTFTNILPDSWCIVIPKQ